MIRRTLVFVHAHPDDEAIFTAGTTRLHADAGDRVVLITCTNGRLGYDPNGHPGLDPEHQDQSTAEQRRRELLVSAELLGFTDTFFLNYADSGMAGWTQNEEAASFVQQPVAQVAARIAEILKTVGADVVITYDEYGYYGHPDHIHVNEVTRAAVTLAPSVQRLAYVVTPRSLIRSFVPAAEAMGVALPAWISEPNIGADDTDIDVSLDLSAYAATKQEAIRAHASQIDNADFMTMDPELFRLAFGTEFYTVAWQRDGIELPIVNLLEGLT